MFGKGRTSQNRHVLITLMTGPIGSLLRQDVATLVTDRDQPPELLHYIYSVSKTEVRCRDD